MVGTSGATKLHSPDLVKRYIKHQYGEDVTIVDCEDRNQSYDILGWHNSFSIRIEYKNRFFYTGISEKHLYQNDILIELIQTLPYFLSRGIPSNRSIDDLYEAQKINTALGWFYKCSADRLFYFRFLDDRFFDLSDIGFALFKPWLLNNLNRFSLQYSDKTTGTINLVLPLSDIPKPLISRLNRNRSE